MKDDDKEIIRAICGETAKETVKELLLALGFDVSNPTHLQRDMAYLRNLREGSARLQENVRRSCIGAAVTAFLFVLWQGIKAVKLN